MTITRCRLRLLVGRGEKEEEEVEEVEGRSDECRKRLPLFYGTSSPANSG
jgi:hypothetical protein